MQAAALVDSENVSVAHVVQERSDVAVGATELYEPAWHDLTVVHWVLVVPAQAVLINDEDGHTAHATQRPEEASPKKPKGHVAVHDDAAVRKVGLAHDTQALAP